MTSEEKWEVRTPLIYGSKHVGFFRTKDEAVATASKLAVEMFGAPDIVISGKCVYVKCEDN